jgi:hypothetical protein
MKRLIGFRFASAQSFWLCWLETFGHSLMHIGFWKCLTALCLAFEWRDSMVLSPLLDSGHYIPVVLRECIERPNPFPLSIKCLQPFIWGQSRGNLRGIGRSAHSTATDT